MSDAFLSDFGMLPPPAVYRRRYEYGIDSKLEVLSRKLDHLEQGLKNLDTKIEDIKTLIESALPGIYSEEGGKLYRDAKLSFDHDIKGQGQGQAE